MISRVQFDAYDKAIQKIEDDAAAIFKNQLTNWMAANDGADVAAIRDAAVGILKNLTGVFQEQSSGLAAAWYDATAGKAHVKLPAAITITEDKAHTIERVAHYKAQKLVDGDFDGFMTECQRYITGEVRQTINKTIVANCARDKGRGVRYARVPAGGETCGFCLMLASRGAVCHTRSTAGEMNHYHTHCRCKVVPGFKAARDDELVEGYRPKEQRDMAKRIMAQDSRVDNETAYQMASQVLNYADIYDVDELIKWQTYARVEQLKAKTQKLDEHILGTKSRLNRVRQLKDGEAEPSYFIESDRKILEKLTRNYVGSGVPDFYKGRWSGGETVTANKVIGYNVGNLDGISSKTRKFKIHYSEDFKFHIVPTFDEEWRML